MGGSDTIRGITYQHACAIAASLDVVEDPRSVAIRIEASDDVVDFDILDVNKRCLRIAQVKTKAEPDAFSAAEIVQVLKRWHDLSGEKADTYEFLSDGQLGPKANRNIKEPLEALRSGTDRGSIDVLLQQAGIESLSDDFLKRVRIRTRNGDTGSVLDSAELRLLRLAEMSGRVSAAEATARIDALFRSISVRSGSTIESERIFSREELASVLGLDLAAIDRRQQWTKELGDEYRASITSVGSVASIVLTVSRASSVHPALRLQTLSLREPLSDVRYSADSIASILERCAIEGPTGAGKSTTLELIASRVAKEGGLPILISPSRYIEGTIKLLMRESIESVTNRLLAPRSLDAVLTEESCVLLLDGLTERPLEELNHLRTDLLELLDQVSKLRLIVSGRRSEGFRLPGTRVLALDGLDENQRKELADLVLQGNAKSSLIRRQVENALGGIVENPLLFTMALSLTEGGYEISTRSSLYRGIVQGLWARQRHDAPEEAVEEVLSRLARALVENGQFSTNRSDWLAMTSTILDALRTEQRLSLETMTAQDMYGASASVGLVRSPSFSRDVAFLHDSFRDYFASRSYRRHGLPKQLTAEYEASIELFCEEAGVSPELRTLATTQNPVLCCRIAFADRRTRTGGDAIVTRDALSHLLENHLGRDIDGKTDLAAVGVRLCWTSTHSWLALTNRGDADEVSTPEELNRQAPALVFAEQGELGPLALACQAWRRLAVAAIREAAMGERTWNRTFGYSFDELMVQIERHASERQAAIREIATRTLPSISNRMLAVIGPTGLQARIDESTTARDTEHLMYYRHEDGPNSVVKNREQSAGDAYRFWGQTSAESYLSKGPRRTASDDLLEAFNKLLRRLGTERWRSSGRQLVTWARRFPLVETSRVFGTGCRIQDLKHGLHWRTRLMTKCSPDTGPSRGNY